MTDLSVIIVNWNTRDLLTECLQSVYDTIDSLDFEVIVVDNASTDDSVEKTREQFPQVRLIENRENAGFAKANNQAIDMAQGRYLLLLNTDAFVHEGAVKSLVSHMEANSDTGAAGCRLFYQDSALQRSCFSFPSICTELWQCLWLDKLFPNHPVFGKYQMTYWNFDDLREVDSVLGACMIIRKEAIDQVGRLDEQFFMYSEEVDLCYRLKKAGWTVHFVPHATATHIWGGSSHKRPKDVFLQLYRSRVLFFRKHFGPFKTRLYKLILLLSSVLRVTMGSIYSLIQKDPDVRQSLRNYWGLLQSLWAF